MWQIRHSRHALGAVAVLLGLTLAARAVPPVDPVEELRLNLRAKDESEAALKNREAKLRKDIAALRTLSDLRRALALTEWRDRDKGERDPDVSLVDRKVRTLVGQRFIAGVKAIVTKGDSRADPNVAVARVAVARMLGEMGADIRALDPAEKVGFARSLTPQLIQLTRDPSPEVRVAAASALGKIFPDPRAAAAAFRTTLQKDGVEQRRAAARGLEQLIQVVSALQKTGRAQLHVEAYPKDVIDAGTVVMDLAGLGLADRDEQVRLRTLDAVLLVLQAFREQIPDPLGADTLPDPREAQKKLREQRALFAPLVRVIGQRGSAIARLLSDPDPNARLRARRALELIAESRERLLRWAGSIPPLPPAGAALPGAVVRVAQKGEEGGEDKDDPLLRAVEPGLRLVSRGLKDPDPRVRLATVEFLESLESGAEPAIPVLVEALGDCDGFIRWAAARTFGKLALGDSGAVAVRAGVVPALARLLQDDDVDVGKAAAAALESFGPQAASAVTALAKAAVVTDTEVRVASMAALGSIGPPRAGPAVPALTAGLRASDADVRRTAAETLGKLGPLARDAVPALRRALRDDNPAVRRAASDALLSILAPAAAAPKE
jgi:HEAT repeat protein